jgi:hypothetical protein
MVEGTVWVGKRFVRPRLSSEELWLLYRLLDGEYWLLRKHPHPLRDVEKISRLRRKMLRLVNGCRRPEYQISLRQRVY